MPAGLLDRDGGSPATVLAPPASAGDEMTASSAADGVAESGLATFRLVLAGSEATMGAGASGMTLGPGGSTMSAAAAEVGQTGRVTSSGCEVTTTTNSHECESGCEVAATTDISENEASTMIDTEATTTGIEAGIRAAEAGRASPQAGRSEEAHLRRWQPRGGAAAPPPQWWARRPLLQPRKRAATPAMAEEALPLTAAAPEGEEEAARGIPSTRA